MTSPQASVSLSHKQGRLLKCRCLFNRIWVERHKVPNSELLMCRRFTLIFTTNFVGSLDIRASREVFPSGVRSPEIRHKRIRRQSQSVGLKLRIIQVSGYEWQVSLRCHRDRGGTRRIHCGISAGITWLQSSDSRQKYLP
jgi:hypothetical protein